MELIFNFDKKLPDVSARFDVVRPLDSCILWVRDAITYMVTFNQLDQNYVFSISLKTILGDEKWKAAWNDAKTHNKNTIEFHVELTEDHFPEQECIRLRGVSATVVESNKKVNGLCKISITPPKAGGIQHPNTQKQELTPLDQSNVPTCNLGRVSTRHSVREPDVVGLVTLHNVSPIGDPKNQKALERSWFIALQRKTTANEDVMDFVVDVQIDFSLAVR